VISFSSATQSYQYELVRTFDWSTLLIVGECTSGIPASRSPLMSRSSAIASSRNRCRICQTSWPHRCLI